MPIASVFRPVLLALVLASGTLFSSVALGQTVSSTVSDGFNPNVDGNIYAVELQSDGKVLLAGKFNTLQPTGEPQAIARQNIARLLRDGRIDSSFNASTNGQIQTVVIEPDGQILIGGKFTEVNGVTRRRLARLNADGSLDATFDPNIEPRSIADGGSMTPEVMAVALQADGKIVVGGGFTGVQPAGEPAYVVRKRLARFLPDGSLDRTFDPAPSAMVVSLKVQADGRILVGGGFKSFAALPTATKYKHFARLNVDGTLDQGFAPQPDNTVNAIELLADGRILIGGSFITLKPDDAAEAATTALRISALNADGTISSSFTSNADGTVSVLKLQRDGSILVGGSFYSLGASYSAYFGRLLPGGGLDSTFFPAPNHTVQALAVQADGSIILGGTFTTLAGKGNVSVVRRHVARISPGGALDNDFRPDVNGRIQSLTQLPGGKLLVGGSFTSIAGDTRSGVVRLNANGSIDTTFRADVDGYVLTAIQLEDGRIIIGGKFSVVNGVKRLNLARLFADGRVDEDFDPAPDGQVGAMILLADGKLLIGGDFTTLSPFKINDPVSRHYLARINPDGTLDLTFNAETSSAVYAMAKQADGEILLGGAFATMVGSGETTGYYRYGMARLNTDGTVDSGFNPNVTGSVYTIVVQPDKKILLGGAFSHLQPNPPTDGTTPADPVARNSIARLNEDGTLDTSFDPNVNGAIGSLLVQADGSIVIGGAFSALRPGSVGDGEPRYYVARVTSTGALDKNFNLFLDVLPGNVISGLALTADNKIVIAGSFTQVGANSVPRARLARVNSDGSVDTAFNSGLGALSGAQIQALTVEFNGGVLVSGQFANLNGANGSSLARFHPDSAPDTTFVPSVRGAVHTIVEAPEKGGTISTQHSGLAWLQANGQLRTGFSLDSAITAMSAIRNIVVQPDGKVLIAATFALPDRNNDGTAESPALCRFLPSGALDPDFRMLTTGTISAIALLSDGKMLIGGTFSTVDGATRANFAKLNVDGSLDTSFTPSVNGDIQTIVLQGDGKMLLGGAFTTVTPAGASSATSRAYILRLNADGTLDGDFNPNPNDAVQTIHVRADGKILIGGGFTYFSKTVNTTTTTTTRDCIALLNKDGSVDESLNLNANGYVSTIVAQPDGDLLIGGYFTQIGGDTRNFLARLKGDTLALDASFNPNPNAGVPTITVQSDGKIVAGGAFTALQPGSFTYDSALATPRNRIVRLNKDGTIDGTFNPNFNGQVSRVAMYNPNGVQDGTILVAGSFATIQPFGAVMAGGDFDQINGVAVKNLALFGSDGSVSSVFQPNPNAPVRALLTLLDGSTVVGGDFTQLAGATRNHIARFDTDNLLVAGFNPNANGPVYALAVDANGKLLVGGDFTTIGGLGRGSLARLNADGSVDASFSSSVTGRVIGIAVQGNGRIFVLTAGSGADNVLRRLMPDGTIDGSFTPATGATGAINTFALQTDGRVVVGGAFTAIGGGARSYLARLNADGSLDASVTSAPNGAVTAVAVQRDGKILIGGQFNSVDGLPRFGLARVVTSTSSTSGDAFTISSDGTVVTWTRSGVGPELSGVYFEASDDLTDWEKIGNAARVAGTNDWRLSGVSLASGYLYVRASAIVPTTPNSSSGLLEAQGRLTTVTLPAITSAAVVGSAAGSSFYYAIVASGEALSYWATGLPAGLTIDARTGVITGTATQPGTYTVLLGATNASGTATMNLTLIVGAAAGAKVQGSAVEAGVNIRHANGKTYDQFLLTGGTASLRADPGEIVRLSFIDLDDDIVQVEFSGAGRFSVTLSGATGPAAPTLYNQAGVAYMKGHATIAVTGADETSNLSVFSVGALTAVNQGLFRSGVNYDGIADIAAISITSTNSRFGGLRCANVAFFSDSGTTGVSASGVQFTGPVYIGDISAFGTASPTLLLGSAQGVTSINGGDLDQPNGAAVAVSGLTQLKFVDGTASDREALPAQRNKAVLKQDGVDVTAQIVVNP